MPAAARHLFRMIAISSKSRYGLKALLDLAASHRQGPVPLNRIAARQNIPRQFLEQIFNQLGKAGFVNSVRGKYGGYTLARPPGDILASEVILQLEGGLDFIPAGETHQDAVADLLRDAREKLLLALGVSLEELTIRQQVHQNTIHYEI